MGETSSKGQPSEKKARSKHSRFADGNILGRHKSVEPPGSVRRHPKAESLLELYAFLRELHYRDAYVAGSDYRQQIREYEKTVRKIPLVISPVQSAVIPYNFGLSPLMVLGYTFVRMSRKSVIS